MLHFLTAVPHVTRTLVVTQKQWREDRKAFRKRVRKTVSKSQEDC